jgi:hypothetical protein
MDKTYFFLSIVPFCPFLVLVTWLDVGAPPRIQGKLSLIPVVNGNSPRVHIELEVDVFGTHGKLVKYVRYSSKSEN